MTVQGDRQSPLGSSSFRFVPRAPSVPDTQHARSSVRLSSSTLRSLVNCVTSLVVVRPQYAAVQAHRLLVGISSGGSDQLMDDCTVYKLIDRPCSIGLSDGFVSMIHLPVHWCTSPNRAPNRKVIRLLTFTEVRLLVLSEPLMLRAVICTGHAPLLTSACIADDRSIFHLSLLLCPVRD